MKIFRSRHRAQKLILQRRTFLAAAGLGISLPLALKMSKMAVAAPGDRPSRLFIYFVPHGAPVEHLEPGDGMSLETGEGILAPLDPFKKHLTYMRGVSNYVMDNHAAIRSVLTGDEAYDSIDYLIANELKTTAHVLGAHSYRSNSPGPDADSKLVKHGSFVTPTLNPADALDDLFAGLEAIEQAPGAPMGDADFRREALELTEGEVAALQKKVSGLTNESNKLRIHLDSIRSLKAASENSDAVISCEARPALPTAEGLAGKDVFSMDNFNAIVEGHLEASANALVCGSARVITMQNMYANAQLNMDFPGGPGIAQNHHDPLSHSLDMAGRANFAKCQRWFYQKLADNFLTLLDVPDPQDPEHTVLDNTTVFCCSEINDGNSHKAKEETNLWFDGKGHYSALPWNIIGGGAGLFQGGRVANMEGIDHRNILAAVAESMGVSLSSIGGESVSTPSEVKA